MIKKTIIEFKKFMKIQRILKICTERVSDAYNKNEELTSVVWLVLVSYFDSTIFIYQTIIRIVSLAVKC